MFRKSKKMIVTIFLVWIFICVIFIGAVEAQVVKESLDVEVGNSETEIIGSTYTDKWRNRRFRIENGENEIIATAWGSNDEKTWEFWKSETIDPGKTETMVLGTNHWWYVKLTGRITDPSGIVSIVDSSLTYYIP
ncbi:MAG: hypothetical protein JSV09_09215 [Thermoplasmata archaeon]|nr:MAG: hypothetical protein JSV09_09215 [Thermoplasmata archaeon]